MMKTPPSHPGRASESEVKDLLQPKLDEPADERVNIKDANAEEVEVLNAEFTKAQLKRLIDDNKARKIFSQRLFFITVLWMFIVLAIVIQCGRKKITLSDGVLIALITTTTANVFGFFYVVVNYLFNKDKST
ncbi:hypothetical protein [Niastella populi]|uniref:Uncharacterized protein n=1 Tax=Niastella populi TaxID=550983 RepID=A0A1V9FM88_9BACT|nr:hypothetical protein [Niastella populi]OQP59366.1 hypothetical protein A4R26_21350 [Niastella populi]